ncbi:hypothetical protein AB669_03615 [Pedobacter sp. BMA]|nr:hypothetical protein AB669_03615 [Pedobacter sp. BMA]
MSEFIHYTTYSVNEKLSWRQNFKARLLWQGVIYPLVHTVAAILLAEIYFLLLETSTRAQGYFVYDFPMVVCFLLIVNLYYVIADFAAIKMPRRKKLPNHKPPPLPLTGPTVPAMFFSEGKANYVILFNGKYDGWGKSLRETIEELPPEFYFQINKGHIVHRELISHYEEHTSLRLIVYFYEPMAKNPGIVVQRNVKDFKDWYEGEE